MKRRRRSESEQAAHRELIVELLRGGPLYMTIAAFASRFAATPEDLRHSLQSLRARGIVRVVGRGKGIRIELVGHDDDDDADGAA